MALLALAAGEVHAAAQWSTGPTAFDRVLICGATLIATACALWFWWTTTAVFTASISGVAPGAGSGATGTARRIVAMACGLTVAAGATPAHAEERATVAGMPPQPLTAPAIAGGTAGEFIVRPGDSLWSVSQEALRARGRAAHDADVARTWQALWHANRTTIADPDLIEPGQRLALPETLR